MGAKEITGEKTCSMIHLHADARDSGISREGMLSFSDMHTKIPSARFL